MAFVCPNCGFPQALMVDRSINLPPDSRSDDIVLQTLRCDLCRFRGAAVYEESRRGSMDSESWDHRGYMVSDGDVEWLSAMIDHCPELKNKRCGCKTHKELSRKDDSGRWLMPENITWEETFPMRLR